MSELRQDGSQSCKLLEQDGKSPNLIQERNHELQVLKIVQKSVNLKRRPMLWAGAHLRLNRNGNCMVDMEMHGKSSTWIPAPRSQFSRSQQGETASGRGGRSFKNSKWRNRGGPWWKQIVAAGEEGFWQLLNANAVSQMKTRLCSRRFFRNITSNPARTGLPSDLLMLKKCCLSTRLSRRAYR